MSATRVNGLVVGMWKFDDRVGAKVLGELALGLQEANPGSYGQMFVRRCSRDQLAICFSYKLGTQSYNHFSKVVTDMLKQKFGNDFVGTDFTSDVWVIDGRPIL